MNGEPVVFHIDHAEALLAQFQETTTYRRLNRTWTCPGDDTWWTTGGSKRELPDARSVEAAVNYIRNQPNPLLIWTREDGIVVSARQPPQ